jgi:hypothetical protein
VGVKRSDHQTLGNQIIQRTDWREHHNSHTAVYKQELASEGMKLSRQAPTFLDDTTREERYAHVNNLIVSYFQTP